MTNKTTTIITTQRITTPKIIPGTNICAAVCGCLSSLSEMLKIIIEYLCEVILCVPSNQYPTTRIKY